MEGGGGGGGVYKCERRLHTQDLDTYTQVCIKNAYLHRRVVPLCEHVK